MKKQANIHILPTLDTGAFILKGELDGEERLICESSVALPGFRFQHIVLTDEEEIRLGDYYLTPAHSFEYSVYRADTERLTEIANMHGAKRIIACTDLRLETTAKLSKSFLADYTEHFTKSETDIYVEYEVKHLLRQPPIEVFEPKIQDGYIVAEIKSRRQNFTREEVTSLLYKTFDLGMSTRQLQLQGIHIHSNKTGREILQEWIEKNL